MSRFSKAEAEARGWVFVHERGEREVIESATQGRTRYEPGSVRAEKYLSLPGRAATLINEEADTIGLLLERIYEYETHLDRALGRDTVPVPVDLAAMPLDDAGDPVRSVVVAVDPTDLSLDAPKEKITEAEWASRDRTGDTIVRRDGDGVAQSIHFGGVEEAVAAEETRLALTAEIENARAAEGHADVPREQVVFDDTQSAVDGRGNSGTLIVREGESLADLDERRQRESDEAENARVVAAQDQGFEAVAPEEAELLAGVDAGIQHRSDLESEIPPGGRTVNTIGENNVFAIPPGVGPTEEAIEAEHAAQEDAIEEKVSEQLDAGEEPTDAKQDKAALRAGLEARLEDEPEAAPEATEEPTEAPADSGEFSEASEEAPEQVTVQVGPDEYVIKDATYPNTSGAIQVEKVGNEEHPHPEAHPFAERDV